MTALSTLTSTGSESVVAFRGPRVRFDTPVLLVHGFGVDGTFFLDDQNANVWARGCSRAGHRSYAAELGGINTWGNDDFLDAVDDALDWGSTTYGTGTDKVALVGVSMGTWALEWAWLNPDQVVACAIVLPTVDMASLHDRNPSGLGDAMETAYGGEAGLLAALPDRDPAQNTDLVAAIADRVALFYSSTDDIGLASEVDTFVDATGVHAVDVGAVGHSLEWDQQQVLDWLIPTIVRHS